MAFSVNKFSEKLRVTVLDTITTRFFMLFVFMMTVPLAALAFFSASIIKSDVEQDIQRQMKLSEHLFDVYLDARYQQLSAMSRQMAQAIKQNPAGVASLQTLCPMEGWVSCRVVDPALGQVFGLRTQDADALDALGKVRNISQPRFWVLDNDIQLLAVTPLSQSRLLVLSEPLQQGVLNPLFENEDMESAVLKPFIRIVSDAPGQTVLAAGGKPETVLPTEADLLTALAADDSVVKINNDEFRVERRILPGPDGQKLATVFHLMSTASQQSLLNYYFTGTYLMGIAGLVFAILVALLAGRPITQPLLKLIEQVNNLSRENVMDGKVDVHGVHEINQLNDAFNRMFGRLREEQKMKDEFVATLTHDLKVPMIAEKQTLAYMRSETYGPLTEIQQEVVEGLQTANESCLSLVNGILQVYRYESGQMTLLTESVEIDALLDEVIGELKPLAIEKNIELGTRYGLAKDGDGNAAVHADRLEIKRVLHNLISNAITNTTRGGKVTCRISDAASWGQDVIYKVSQFQYTTLKSPLELRGRILVSVEDTGIGFSPEDMPNLFRQFAIGQGRNPMSLGLGLYNCYQVVQAHNGSLWVETSEGEGSAVCFLLPVDATVAKDRRKRRDRRKNA